MAISSQCFPEVLPALSPFCGFSPLHSPTAHYLHLKGQNQPSPLGTGAFVRQCTCTPLLALKRPGKLPLCAALALPTRSPSPTPCSQATCSSHRLQNSSPNTMCGPHYREPTKNRVCHTLIILVFRTWRSEFKAVLGLQ